MNNHKASIQCIKPDCQNFNLETETFCSRCQTPILKRYLWTLTLDDLEIGSFIEERYLVKQAKIVIDTKPSQIPHIPEEVPESILPYLQLSPYKLHIPQVYGLLPTPSNSEIWLLEYNHIPLTPTGELTNQNFFAPLQAVWHKAKPLRQLNWLWQIAKLWKPLESKKVSASLLNPELLKVNGSLVQLQELELNGQKEVSLSELGDLWASWVTHAAPEIKEFCKQVVNNLQQGKIQSAEELTHILDQGLSRWGQQQERSYEIFTQTDPGPSREHNEDACAPPPGKLVKTPPRAIVCDGLGGQEGGEIASKLAISSLSQELEKLAFEQKNWQPEQNLKELQQIINTVNDQISKRNDEENRRDRQRMGTTLLMALVQNHEMYLTHVGDSRIYLINESGCYQLTVDDDLASREVRLGYTIYRDALQYPSSGALIQALGMSSSRNLHPTLQRLVVDEDSLFLLCSDGLSDFDRVEQYWRREILPILTEGIPLDKVVENLVAIANEKNGHDNVTVALVHCQVKDKPGRFQTLQWAEIQEAVPTVPDLTPTPAPIVAAAPTKIPVAAPPATPNLHPKTNNLLFPIIAASVFGLLALLLFWFLRRSEQPTANFHATPTPTPTTTVVETPATSPEPEVIAGDILSNPEEVENVEQGPNFLPNTYWLVAEVTAGKQYKLKPCGQTYPQITIPPDHIIKGIFVQISKDQRPDACPPPPVASPEGPSTETDSGQPSTSGELPRVKQIIIIISSNLPSLEKDKYYRIEQVPEGENKFYWLQPCEGGTGKLVEPEKLKHIAYNILENPPCPLAEQD